MGQANHAEMNHQGGATPASPSTHSPIPGVQDPDLAIPQSTSLSASASDDAGLHRVASVTSHLSMMSTIVGDVDDVQELNPDVVRDPSTSTPLSPSTPRPPSPSASLCQNPWQDARAIDSARRLVNPFTYS
ncbi:hypothetical protein K474DRAFT_463923 [Panus rudis PR-1116 ss-1]|nr:hypothetical protein K474DRAFT_463923 [Panus rudis PR-1116 ss-1]